MNLQGKTILVTRQKEQSADFVAEIESLGGRALLFPMIRITDPDSWEECDRALDQIESFEALVFTSANGVEGFFRRSAERKIPHERLRALDMMAVGEKTKESVERRGFHVRVVPEAFSAQSLTTSVTLSDVAGKKILAPRGNLGREEIREGLGKLGAIVHSVVVYKNVKPLASDRIRLWNHLKKREVDVVSFFSPSAVVNFSAIVSPEQLRSLGWSFPIAVIGPTTRDAAQKRGYDVAIMGTAATVKGLVRAIAEYFDQ